MWEEILEMRCEELTPLLEVKGVTKRFGGILALNKVNLGLYRKEILALLGDNGAGKSTLIKVISGIYQLEEGEIFIEGEKTIITSPRDAKNLGIETVYQDLALFGVLNVQTNLFMGKEMRRKFGILNKTLMGKETVKILARLKVKVKSINQQVRDLSGGQQHAIAIGRAVYVGDTPRIILMDEPTAGLGVEESNKVLDLMLELKDKGISVILISHNLDHVFAVADRAVVLRSGESVGERKIKETTHTEIVHMMMGVV